MRRMRGCGAEPALDLRAPSWDLGAVVGCGAAPELWIWIGAGSADLQKLHDQRGRRAGGRRGGVREDEACVREDEACVREAAMPFIIVNKMLSEAGDTGHVGEPVSVSDAGEHGRSTLLNRRRCSPAPPASRLCSAVARSSWSIFGCCLEYFCLWHLLSGAVAVVVGS